MINSANSQGSVFCAYEGCTRDCLPYSRYCQFCQRKGAQRDYRLQAQSHRDAVKARRRAESHHAPEPWKVLYAYCKPADGKYGSTHTYAIGVGRFVKFGQALDVEGRLMNLQIASPYRLRLLGKVWSSREMEHHIHDALKQHTHRGEWFRLNDETDEFIRLINANDIIGLAQRMSSLLQSGTFTQLHSYRNDLNFYDENTVIV